MAFKLKKMTKKEILLAQGLSGNYECWSYDYLLAQAAQLDAIRQVREWGIEQCQEHYTGGGVCSKRECPECWQSLNKLGVPG